MGLLMVGISTVAYAGSISLVYDGNMTPDPNTEITVEVHSDTPLYIFEAFAIVTGDANIITAMSSADCNQYGFDPGWQIDPYIDPNGWVYFGGISWPNEANNVVGYFTFTYHSGQVVVSIEDGGCTIDTNCEPVPFSENTLTFGVEDQNDSMGQSLGEQNTDEIPVISSELQPTLMYCPADACNGSEPFSKVAYENLKSERTADDSGGQMMETDSVITISSNITTNQIWTSGNTYHVVADVNVRALLVIEPGTVVYYGSNGVLRVNNGGTLISCGAPDDPIVYTSDSSNPDFGDYYCPICIEETASPSTKVNYSYVEYAYAGIIVKNNRLDTPIENNYFFYNVYGVVEFGTRHTDILNNLIYYSYYSGIEVYLASQTGTADANSHILIENNTCDYYQDDGITVHGVASSSNAGTVMLLKNIVAESYQYGMNLVDGYMMAAVVCTGYYDNADNKNWDFEESNSVVASSMPFVDGAGYFDICNLNQTCPFINAGLDYVEQTHLIGMTTDVNSIPDSNFVDIGFHYFNWDYNNVGEGDYYPSDLNEDRIINFNDFAILANGWQTTYNINDLVNMCEYWLLQGGPTQNIVPTFDQDPNEITGNVNVTISVSDSKITNVYLFIDGEKYSEYGDIQENPTVHLKTQYFRNGPHTVKIISQDINDMVYCSEFVDVNFNNPVSSLIMDKSFKPGEDYHIMALGGGDYNVSVYDIVNENISYSGTSTGQINIIIPATAFPEEYGAYDFKMTPQGDPNIPLVNSLIRRTFTYKDLYDSGDGDNSNRILSGTRAGVSNNWIMKMVISIGDEKLEKDKEKCWRGALRAGVKQGYAPGVIVPSDGDEWFNLLKLAITYEYCKIWYHVGHGNYKTIWPWNPERTFISSPSGKIFSYLKKDFSSVPPDYETVWGYEHCHSICELGQANNDKMIWVQINACYSVRNTDFMECIGTPNDDPLHIGTQVFIGWKNSALVHDILGNYNQFEEDYWDSLCQGNMLKTAVEESLPPGGGTNILENFQYYGVSDWQYVWFNKYPNIN